MTGRDPAAGVTLIEVLVALSIFALIGVAGFSMLDQVLRTERQTEGRLEDLAAVQRAMFLISQDFDAARPASLSAEDVVQSGQLRLTRSAPEAPLGQISLTYRQQDADLLRLVLLAGSAEPVRQTLLDRVQTTRWRFYDRDTGWTDRWPPPGWIGTGADRPANPQAVELTVAFSTGRELRRVALLPGAPE